MKLEIVTGDKSTDKACIWGNNAAFACPVCRKVFIISAFFSKPYTSRTSAKIDCPSCGESIAEINKVADKKYKASISIECKSEEFE
jgi:predicted RNA-binding Zn-ribbon protein involved in translation (DUF1610 family)